VGPGVVHLATLGAGLVLLVVVDRHLWFFGDDWNFIADRGLHHPSQGIWQPHNEHWSTLPILLWRALFSLFSLGSYWPYLLPVLLAHVAIAHLLWRAGTKEGAGRWVATACVAIFVGFGAGAENLTWAFQIGFVGSLLFGWAAVLLVSRRRSPLNEAAIAALLAASLACSTVGDAMLVAAAVVLLCRRGWRAAVRTLAMPATGYITWYLLAGKNGTSGDHIGTATFLGLPRYLWDGLSGSLGSAVDLRPAGSVLLAILLAWLVVSFGSLRRRSPSVLGGVAGALAFFLLAGLGRYGQPGPTASRYVYVCIALLLPAVMAGATDLTQWARQPLKLVALLVGAMVLALNVHLLVSYAGHRTSFVLRNKQQLLDIATMLAGGTPSLDRQPVPFDPDLNTDTLIRFVRDGTLPHAALTAPARLEAEVGLEVGSFPQPPASARGRFELRGMSKPGISRRAGTCLEIDPAVREVALSPLGSPAVFEMRSAPSKQFNVFLVSNPDQQAPGAVLTTEPDGITYVVDLVPGELLIVSLPSNGATTLCGLSSA
jgi:hypothetical protein